MLACGSSGATPSADAGGDLGFIPDAGANCPAETPLACNGSCVSQDNTHCAACTDVCGPGSSCQAGQCLCADPKQRLCNSTCIDVESDPNNCGACGRSCFGAACTATACAPLQLAPAAMPFGIATDGKMVYWTNNVVAGSVMAVGVDGGAPTQLAGAQSSPRDIVFQNNTVYWTNDAAGTWQIHSVLATGGNPQLLFSGMGSPKGLTVDSDSDVDWAATDATGAYNVYFTQGGVPADGGPPTPLATTPDQLGGITSDSNNIYWTDSSLGAIYVYVVSTGSMPNKLGGIAGPLQIAVDTASIYVTTTSGGVATTPITTAAPAYLATGLSQPYGIALDDNFVYFTDRAGSVLKASKGSVDGGAPTVLATGQNNPTNLAVDNVAVYWTNNAVAGAIMKVAK
jgi:hypothetical protein